MFSTAQNLWCWAISAPFLFRSASSIWTRCQQMDLSFTLSASTLLWTRNLATWWSPSRKPTGCIRFAVVMSWVSLEAHPVRLGALWAACHSNTGLSMGFGVLGIRELRQLIFGSTLLLFTLESFVLTALGGGPALLEHPAEPADSHCVSIWRLVLVAFAEHLPGVSRYDIRQECMGSESAKPTSLLSANIHIACGNRRSLRPAEISRRQSLRNIPRPWTGPWHVPLRMLSGLCL